MYNYLHKENYGIFPDVNDIDIREISRDYNYHYNSILNMIIDHIDDSDIMRKKYRVFFTDGEFITLTTFDLFINIIMWHLPINCGIPVTSDYILFDDVISGRSIAEYIDNIIDDVKTIIPIKDLNNYIADMVIKFNIIDKFSNFTCNSISLIDLLKLKNRSSGIDDVLCRDISQVPFKDVKEVTNDMAIEFKNYVIKDRQSGLYPYMKSGLGFSLKQFRECMISIGIKPDGMGGIFPTPILNSFLNGGCNNPIYTYIDASAARISQIIIESNVGLSGYFANMLSYNNIDTVLNKDPNYTCNTKNFIKVTIKDQKMLNLYNGRYYRFPKRTIEKVINSKKDTHLIGQEIEMRSPITCDSFAKGNGICYKCYGDLAYVNYMLSVGKIASDLLSAKCTQPQLSAKHILEAKIKEYVFGNGFFDYFSEDNGLITCNNTSKDHYLVIEPSSIMTLINEDIENSEDGGSLITSDLRVFDGTNMNRMTDGKTQLTLLTPLIKLLDEFTVVDEELDDELIMIPFSELPNEPLFALPILNDDLLSIIVNAQKCILLKSHIENLMAMSDDPKSFLSSSFMSSVIEEAGLDVNPIHLETILAAQVYENDDCMKRPDWSRLKPMYTIVDLGKSIRKNPSVIVSLMNGYLSSVLPNYKTFTKNSSSTFDKFFQ